MRICSFANAPTTIVVAGLVFGVLVPSLMSVAVNVFEPAVLAVTESVAVPATSAALPGRAALTSVEVIPTVSPTLTTFQLASTALTVALKAVPAVWLLGAPVFPDALPGEASSPGMRICILTNAPGCTVVAGLVFAVLDPSVVSVAVKVGAPEVFGVTEKTLVPAASAALPGRAAFASVEVIPTVSPTLTTFQFASTALTVALNAVPAVWLLGAPVFPDALPGEATSPGMRICSLTNAPGLTVVAGLVFAVLDPSVVSVAVKVGAPEVFGVTEKTLVPATSAALPGRAAFASVEVIPTVSVTVGTTFQFASTALTVALNAVPAV